MAAPAPAPCRGRLLILYGSQTGNAQDVAERLAREAALLLFAPAVLPMDSYQLARLPEERYAVFVAATTGQGDPPDNMRRFWKALLRKSLPPTALAGLSFAVFGLGDSGYVKFNVAAKKLDRRLAALGATPLLERGLGDDQHPSGYEATLDPWVQQLWSVLRQRCQLPPSVQEPLLDEETLLQLGPAKFKATLLPGPPAAVQQQQQQRPLTDVQREQALMQQAVAAAAAFRAVAAEAAGVPAAEQAVGGAAAPGGYGPWRPFMAPLLANRRVTSAEHFQDTRHIELDLAGSGLDTYQPGDLLCIFPRTPPHAVEAALERLGLCGDAWVRITAAQPHAAPEDAQDALGSRAVCEAPLRAVVQGVLDLCGASPRRYFFQVLSHFAHGSQLQQERLRYFATAEGREDLYRYNQAERRSLLEVLQDFSAAAPPLERLLEAAPLLLPRQFSLASAPAAHGSRAAILVAVVAWRTPSQRPRHGLLTSWLAGLQPGPQPTSSNSDGGVAVPVWIERGAFRLPPSPDTPLLLVGPGTGVAPFRSFCWHRAATCRAQQQQVQAQAQQQAQQQPQQAQQGQAGAPAGSASGAAAAGAPAADSMLFFGCRAPAADFYYRDEWLSLMQQHALHPQHGLVVAFSRHSPQPSQQQLLAMLRDAAAGGAAPAEPQPANGAAHAPGDGAAAPEEQPAARGRTYVTHKLREHGAAVWRLLSQQGAWVFVSGSAEKMPAGVVAALEDVAAQHGGLAPEAAAKFVRQLELSGRYHVEAWS